MRTPTPCESAPQSARASADAPSAACACALRCFSPYDNLLCQVSGRKHVLLYPPEATPDLYYGPRRDIQAQFSPVRGEYGRFDTGIVSTNTAEVNGASPDLQAYPRFRDALKLQSYALLEPSDCLFLPMNWHHHVFSEADPEAGYNLALNLWVSREAMLAGVPPRTSAPGAERFPTLKMLTAELEAQSQRAATRRAEQPSSRSSNKCRDR
jgi:hypothetical protein